MGTDTQEPVKDTLLGVVVERNGSGFLGEGQGQMGHAPSSLVKISHKKIIIMFPAPSKQPLDPLLSKTPIS